MTPDTFWKDARNAQPFVRANEGINGNTAGKPLKYGT